MFFLVFHFCFISCVVALVPFYNEFLLSFVLFSSVFLSCLSPSSCLSLSLFFCVSLCVCSSLWLWACALRLTAMSENVAIAKSSQVQCGLCRILQTVRMVEESANNRELVEKHGGWIIFRTKASLTSQKTHATRIWVRLRFSLEHLVFQSIARKKMTVKEVLWSRMNRGSLPTCQNDSTPLPRVTARAAVRWSPVRWELRP